LAALPWPHLAGDVGVLHKGRADLGLAVVVEQENVELDGLALGGVELLDEDDVAVLHAELLSAGLDDRKHFW